MVRFLFLIFVAFSSCKLDSNKEIKKTYYSDEKIKSIKPYVNDSIDGQVQNFYTSGVLKEIISYKHNKKNGMAYYFYPSGALQKFRHWRDNIQNGYVCDYYDDTVGIIKTVILFDNMGKTVYKKHFDSLGNFISEEGIHPTQ